MKLCVLLGLRLGPGSRLPSSGDSLAGVQAYLEPVSASVIPAPSCRSCLPLGSLFNPLAGSSAVGFMQLLQRLNEVVVTKHGEKCLA